MHRRVVHVLLVTLLVFLLGFTAFTRDPWWQQSALLPQFERVAAWLEQRVPAGVREHLHPQAVHDQIKAKLGIDGNIVAVP